MEKKRGLLSGLNKKRRIWTHLLEAKRRRRAFGKKPVIGITGSVGKTTTSGFLHHLLNEDDDTLLSFGENTLDGILARLRKLRSRHRRAVFEVATSAPGKIAESTNILKPNVAVITCVSTDHYSAFKSPEATAKEKGALAQALPNDGLLLLNLDDEHVSQMGALTRARTVYYGQTEDADYRYINVDQHRGSGLQFTVRHENNDTVFHVPVLGAHLIPSLMAAISCAHQMGIAWDVLVERASRFGGVTGRCSLHQMPGRPVYIHDAAKAPFGSAALPFRMLADFDAPRKTVVIGQLSDYRGAQNRAYRNMCKAADQFADRIIVLERVAKYLRKGTHYGEETELCTFESWADLVELIEATLLPNEVILLKSANNYHLDRVILNEVEPVLCKRETCSAQFSCMKCKFLCDAELSASAATAKTWTEADPFIHALPPVPQELSQGQRL